MQVPCALFERLTETLCHAAYMDKVELSREACLAASRTSRSSEGTEDTGVRRCTPHSPSHTASLTTQRRSRAQPGSEPCAAGWLSLHRLTAPPAARPRLPAGGGLATGAWGDRLPSRLYHKAFRTPRFLCPICVSSSACCALGRRPCLRYTAPRGARWE